MIEKCLHCRTRLVKVQDAEFCPNCGMVEEDEDPETEALNYIE